MAFVVSALEERYPQAVCALEHGGHPWRLMVMARLSAQCTDARVNEVCKTLFERFPTLPSLAYAPLEEIEHIVKPCGLWKTKAANIKEECRIVLEDFGGKVPESMEELLSLPGVGRKIANLLRGDIYGLPAIVADTHCIRICGRLGMYSTDLKDAVRVEKIMVDLISPEKQSDFCHRIVQFGRDVCMARSPDCSSCPLSEHCEYVKIKTR